MTKTTIIIAWPDSLPERAARAHDGGVSRSVALLEYVYLHGRARDAHGEGDDDGPHGGRDSS